MPRKTTPALPEQFITLPNAARRLGVSYLTAYTWARAGKLPVYRVSPKLFLVDWKEVVALVEARRVRPGDLPRRSPGDLGRVAPGRKGGHHGTRNSMKPQRKR